MHCKNNFWLIRSLFLATVFLGLYDRNGYAQELTQTITLRPGWNAVWIEVDPTNRQPAVVFAGLPLAGVWTWSERISATDFIQNPEVTGWNRARWLAYFPPNSSQAPLANLYAVLPRRAYLLKNESSSNLLWSVTGKPSVQSDKWSPDRNNLRGFPVDPDLPPTFVDFFRWSPAHYDSTARKLQPIFRLDSAGTWNPVAPTDKMQRGEAYWVYTQGASDYVAPFSLTTTTGDGLDFGASLRQCNLSIHNVSSVPSTVRFDPVSGNPAALLVYDRGQTNDSLSPFAGRTQPVAAQQTVNLGLQLNRLTAGASRDVLLSASDGLGTRFYFYQSGELGLRAGDNSAVVGLWAGTITITNVSYASTNSTVTDVAPVAIPFPLRVLVHVDTNGQASLLREVTLLYDHTVTSSITNVSSSGAGQPSRLITDPAVLSRVAPSDLRANRITARRLSAPHFDFVSPIGRFELPLTGVFAISNQVSGTLSIPADFPTNPFLHRYNPDHGTNAAYAVSREITFSLAPPANQSGDPSGDALGGTFSEIITGLHKLPLFASGAIDLRRVSNTGVLNALSQ